jgi:hypothetical protein
VRHGIAPHANRIMPRESHRTASGSSSEREAQSDLLFWRSGEADRRASIRRPWFATHVREQLKEQAHGCESNASAIRRLRSCGGTNDQKKGIAARRLKTDRGRLG